MQGRYTIYDILDSGIWVPRFTKQNTLMVSFGAAATKLFGFGNRNFRINKIYIEFENTGSAVSAPSYDAYDGRDYYDSLSPPKDYLRVNVLGAPLISIVPGYESYFDADAGEGNRLTFTAQSSGSEGVNGLEFSDGVSSRAYGLALVAAPEDADRTKDVLVTRGYWEDEGDQATKQASGQIAVSWELDLIP